MIREWLDANPVGEDDGLRHDKWCAMMWPRLRLLRELLSETGLLFWTIDDNEQHHARMILEEMFGPECFLATISWVKRYTRSNNANLFYSMKDHVLVYRRSAALQQIKEPRTLVADQSYTNPDDDPRGPWMTSSYVNPATKERRRNLVYSIERPATGEAVEHPTHAWKYSPAEHARHVADGRLWWGADGNAEYPRLKLYLADAQSMVPVDVWNWQEVGSSDDGSNIVKRIFGRSVFDNPKPTGLVEKAISLIDNRDAIVLDSFAGSGTTAHAVLEANKRDGGRRRFILVEGEDYADSVTTERVRRVSQGYKFSGKEKTELLRRKITWSTLKRFDKVLDEIQVTENLRGHEWDEIKKEIKDGELIVTGERTITEEVEGIGGSFTYCTLGESVELDKLLSGETLPTFDALGAALFHMATNRALEPSRLREADSYLGRVNDQHVWLLYRPEIEWLKSPEAALTLSRAKDIAGADPERNHLVFAAARYVSQKMLADRNLPVEFAPLPFALYRIDRS